MRKKWIAAALVCTMGVTSLAGCGNSANSNASTEADAQDTQSDDGVVTLKVWSEESNFDFMNQMIKALSRNMPVRHSLILHWRQMLIRKQKIMLWGTYLIRLMYIRLRMTR